MKKNNKYMTNLSLRSFPGLIIETPKSQIELISMNHYNRVDTDSVLSNEARNLVGHISLANLNNANDKEEKKEK